MAHKTENVKPLAVSTTRVSRVDFLPTPDIGSAQVWLFVLPFARAISGAENASIWLEALHRFALELNEKSLLAILTSPQDAAETWARVRGSMQFQLLVAVKCDSGSANHEWQLPQRHASLLLLSKFKGSLRHTKTRIAYTYCPYCDKTTKDYGGKKHTYHEYGTLLSDVWRDISYAPGEKPLDIINRLADLFALDPYRLLTVVDLSSARALVPSGPRKLTHMPHAPVERGVQRALRLIPGDCLLELRKLPSNSTDFCFADPPYNLSKRYDSWGDALDVRAYLKWCEAWTGELARVLRPGRTCAILNIPILAMWHFQHMKEMLVFQNWIAWEGLACPFA